MCTTEIHKDKDESDILALLGKDTGIYKKIVTTLAIQGTTTKFDTRLDHSPYIKYQKVFGVVEGITVWTQKKEQVYCGTT